MQQFRGCHAVFFVYDITNYESYESLKNYWISHIKDITPDYCLYGLAATKLDIMFRQPVLREV